MDKLKSHLPKVRRHITPFNLVLVAIVATTLYAAFIALGNWSTMRQLDQAAPGHRVQVTEVPANLTVTLFYDYRCSFCYQIDPIIRAAAEKDGEVELLFKFLPALGDTSEYMARIAYAAGQQDKFLEVHDYIISGGNREYDENELKNMSETLALDFDKLSSDIDSTVAKNKVQANMDLALSLGAYSTPTLIIGKDFFIPSGQMPDAEKFQELFNKARQNL